MALVYSSRAEAEFGYREIFEAPASRNGIELRPGDRVFDVRSNIGLFAIHIARECPGVEIYAFEPIPPIFESSSSIPRSMDSK